VFCASLAVKASSSVITVFLLTKLRFNRTLNQNDTANGPMSFVC